jgi:hypothetical protein
MQELPEADKKAFENHLAACPACSHELEMTASVHRWLDHQMRQPIPLQIERDYRRALRRQFRQPFAPLSMLRYIAAGMIKWSLASKPVPRLMQAVALLLLGIWIGHLAFAPQTVITLDENLATHDIQMISGQDLQLINEYMIRSELILLTIVNSSTDSIRKSDMVLNRELAAILLHHSGEVQKKTALLEDEYLNSFVDHMEFVLLEVSNQSEDTIEETLLELRQMIKEAKMVQVSRQVQSRLQQTMSMSA